MQTEDPHVPPSAEDARAMAQDRERAIRRLRRQRKKAPERADALDEEIEALKRERVVLQNYATMGGAKGGSMFISGAPSEALSKHVAGLLQRARPPASRIARASTTFEATPDGYRAKVFIDAALVTIESTIVGVPDVAAMRYPRREAHAEAPTAREAFDACERSIMEQLQAEARAAH